MSKFHVREVSFGTMLTYWGIFKDNELIHYTLSRKDAATMVKDLEATPELNEIAIDGLDG